MINHIETETKISDFVVALTGITPAEMRSPIRSRHIIRARSIYAYLMRLHGFRWAEIGKYLSRDHSTIRNLQRHFEKHEYLREIQDKITAGFPELYTETDVANNKSSLKTD